MLNVFLDLTISKVAKVTLVEAEIVLAEREGSDALLLLSTLLDEMGKDAHDVGEIRINAGPGSFTGVRVAAAIANTFNWVNGKNIPITLSYL